MFYKEQKLIVMGSTESSLKSVDVDSISSVPFQGEMKKCIVPKIIDGDTCTIIFLIGDKPFKINLRISGIDAPEIHGDTQEEMLAAKVSHSILTSIIEHHPKWYVVMYRWDKYGGRVIGDLYFTKKGKPLSSILLEKGCVRKYNGTKKEKWSTKDLIKIMELKH
ncbi:MAG TPA: thermonuclease family protein [Methanosarcina sp.]|nr:thermonuclease family protein [Methanosarcina sp.]